MQAARKLYENSGCKFSLKRAAERRNSLAQRVSAGVPKQIFECRRHGTVLSVNSKSSLWMTGVMKQILSLLRYF